MNIHNDNLKLLNENYNFFSVLFLIIGSLDKSNVQTASKSVAPVAKHAKLKTLMLELMLDVLLLPYKWNGSEEDVLAGFNASSLNRLRLYMPMLFLNSDYHEQVIIL